MALQCESCGSPISDYDRQCPRCRGGRARDYGASSGDNCINCGAAVTLTQEECHACRQVL